MKNIDCFHAHLYYDDSSFEKAEQVIEKARALDGVQVGRMHRRPVGPHPMQSCQLLFGPELLREMMSWLMFNKAGLTVFLHPVTGDDLLDHTDYAVWMGEQKELKLSVLS